MANAILCTTRTASSAVRTRGGVGEAGAVAARLGRFAMIGPLVIALSGCTSERVAPTDAAVKTAPPRVDASVAPATVPAKEASPRPLGAFRITFYYVTVEDEVKPSPPASRAVAMADSPGRPASSKVNDVASDAGDPADDDTIGELASIAVPELVTIYDKTCKSIARVSKEFAAQLDLQGTGRLSDGRMLNVAGRCGCDRSPCFQPTSLKWGNGGTGKPLHPFRTVAVDPRVVKLGSLLYIPALEGRTMPGRAPWGGFVHDGCVVADDTGGAIKGKQLDLFVGRRGYYRGLGRHAWARSAEVFDGSKLCKRDGRRVTRKANGAS